MSNQPKIAIQHQTAFGDDGQLLVLEGSVETSLEDFGAAVDHREHDSQSEKPEVDQFGVDDRPKIARLSESDQSTLFADTDDDQQTLTGEDAATRCLFKG
ncbi:hypothetical protein [Halorussus amylolyticus]|uniref:hypothetical protein n=1 Tax=Halorussus amylolyticus TaxID=1126242 RepID=UPI00104E63CF|nr:hypothetical protein [Halorussus amylolyticus]